MGIIRDLETRRKQHITEHNQGTHTRSKREHKTTETQSNTVKQEVTKQDSKKLDKEAHWGKAM